MLLGFFSFGLCTSMSGLLWLLDLFFSLGIDWSHRIVGLVLVGRFLLLSGVCGEFGGPFRGLVVLWSGLSRRCRVVSTLVLGEAAVLRYSKSSESRLADCRSTGAWWRMHQALTSPGVRLRWDTRLRMADIWLMLWSSRNSRWCSPIDSQCYRSHNSNIDHIVDPESQLRQCPHYRSLADSDACFEYAGNPEVWYCTMMEHLKFAVWCCGNTVITTAIETKCSGDTAEKVESSFGNWAASAASCCGIMAAIGSHSYTLEWMVTRVQVVYSGYCRGIGLALLPDCRDMMAADFVVAHSAGTRRKAVARVGLHGWWLFIPEFQETSLPSCFIAAVAFSFPWLNFYTMMLGST